MELLRLKIVEYLKRNRHWSFFVTYQLFISPAHTLFANEIITSKILFNIQLRLKTKIFWTSWGNCFHENNWWAKTLPIKRCNFVETHFCRNDWFFDFQYEIIEFFISPKEMVRNCRNAQQLTMSMRIAAANLDDDDLSDWKLYFRFASNDVETPTERMKVTE